MEHHESTGPRSSCLSIVLAAAVGVALLVGLFFLTLGAVGPIVAIAVAVLALVAVHYVVWGWWLGGMIRRDVRQEEEAERAHRDSLKR